ncbi:MAG: HAMP domain-containing protein [Desulfobacteraceae bacterium]|nr:MAG: HAMP domain-containing protein [Desulfobacteraceae bacterium]
MIQTRCEKCGKRYRVDEKKILGYRAKFECTACQNTVYIIKPPPKFTPTEKITPWNESTVILKRESYFESGEWQRMKIPLPKEEKHRGLRFASKLTILMLIFILLPVFIFFGFYLKPTQNKIKIEIGQVLTQDAPNPSYPLGNRMTQSNQTYYIFGAVLIYVILGTWLIVFFFTRSLTKIIRLANRMSLGDLNVEIPEYDQGEIGQLSRSLFRLQASLKLSIRALEHLEPPL